jgi:abortive infection bacteriophage resistance protein
MKHFRENYGTYHRVPPVWCAIEVISFGSLVTLYRNTTRKVKKSVSNVFGVPPEVLESWILALNSEVQLISGPNFA